MTMTIKKKPSKRATQRLAICETFDQSEWTLIYFVFLKVNEPWYVLLSFPAKLHFHVYVYVPPRLYSCCVLFTRPDGWSFNSSLSSLEMGKSHTILKAELDSTVGRFQKDLLSETFLFPLFELSTNCASLHCYDSKCFKYQSKIL